MDSLFSCRARVGNVALTVLYQQQSTDPTAGLLLHSHNYAEVFFCLRGVRIVHTESGDFRVGAGEMMIIPAELPHISVETSPNAVIKVYGIYAEFCPDDCLQDLYGRIAPILSGNTIRTFRNGQTLCALIDELVAAPKAPSCVFRTARFLEELLRANQVPGAESAISSARMSTEKERLRLVRLQDLINCEFTHNITLSKAASLLYLSERQLARVVKKEFGTTFRALVLKKQMEAAAELLLTTNASTEAVGQQVGFRAKSGFYRKFVQRYGVTPGEYRRRKRKIEP